MRVEVSTAREEVGDVDELILPKVVRENVEVRLTAYTGAESCERERERERMIVCEKEEMQLLLDLVVLGVGWCLWMVMSGCGGSLPSGL